MTQRKQLCDICQWELGDCVVPPLYPVIIIVVKKNDTNQAWKHRTYDYVVKSYDWSPKRGRRKNQKLGLTFHYVGMIIPVCLA